MVSFWALSSVPLENLHNNILSCLIRLSNHSWYLTGQVPHLSLPYGLFLAILGPLFIHLNFRICLSSFIVNLLGLKLEFYWMRSVLLKALPRPTISGNPEDFTGVRALNYFHNNRKMLLFSFTFSHEYRTVSQRLYDTQYLCILEFKTFITFNF